MELHAGYETWQKRSDTISRVVTIHDENNVPCVDTAFQHQHWQCHFTTVLNIVNTFDKSVSDLGYDSLRWTLLLQISLTSVMSRWYCYRRTETLGILAEILKIDHTDGNFMLMLTELVRVT